MPDLESSRPTPNSGNSPGAHHGYDPNQPRVPSGHSDGGQWTKTGSGTPTIARREAVVDHSKQESWGSYVDGYGPDGSLAEQRVFNRDGSRIVSEFKPPDDPGDWDERHTVVLPDGASSSSRTAAMCSGYSTAKAIWSAPPNGPMTVRGQCRSGSWLSPKASLSRWRSDR
jgi:hypothetical protein